MLEIDYKYINELFDMKVLDFSTEYKSEDYNNLHEIFDEKYNISDYTFSFDLCCSNLIESLFNKFVTPNTIVISSRRDHPSVEKCLSKFQSKEIIYLDDGKYLNHKDNIDPRTRRISVENEFSLRKLDERLANKNYDKIFFLSYGANVCDGEVRENKLFQRIFQICEKNCDQVIKVLDDCQGSLWIPRDYSIFDYILWTAHATIYMFDVGVVISKPDMPKVGRYNVGEEYLANNYRHLLANEEFAMNWNKQLSMATNIHLSRAPHLFNLEFTKDYPDSYFTDIQTDTPNVSVPITIHIEAKRFIRLRVEPFMGNRGKYELLRALKYIYDEREFIKG